MMPNDQIVLAIISAAGGIITTFLVTRYKAKGRTPKKSHMNEILDGFERLIKEQQQEIIGKNKELDRKDAIVMQQQRLREGMEKVKGDVLK